MSSSHRLAGIILGLLAGLALVGSLAVMPLPFLNPRFHVYGLVESGVSLRFEQRFYRLGIVKPKPGGWLPLGWVYRSRVIEVPAGERRAYRVTHYGLGGIWRHNTALHVIANYREGNRSERFGVGCLVKGTDSQGRAQCRRVEQSAGDSVIRCDWQIFEADPDGFRLDVLPDSPE